MPLAPCCRHQHCIIFTNGTTGTDAGIPINGSNAADADAIAYPAAIATTIYPAIAAGLLAVGLLVDVA